METVWDKFIDSYDDSDECMLRRNECPLYSKLKRYWDAFAEDEEDPDYADFCLPEDASKSLEGEVEDHDCAGLGVFHWKSCRGRPVFVLSGACLEEACTPDHVREEHMLTFRLPMSEEYPNTRPFDRNAVPEYAWLPTVELSTLHRLLESEQDFIRIQSLLGLKDWATKGPQRRLAVEPGLVRSVASLVLLSDHSAVSRTAAYLLTLFAKYQPLRHQFLSEPGDELLVSLYGMVTGQTPVRDETCRLFLGKCLAIMTESDFSFIKHFVANFQLDPLFHILSVSTNNDFKMTILKVLNNLCRHPEAVEAMSSALTSEDISFEPLLEAFLSLVPKCQKAGYEILEALLRGSRSMDRMHAVFIREGGLMKIVSLLEEVYDLDSRLALNGLTLIDHLTDTDSGRHAVICTAINILRSIVFFRNSRSPERRRASAASRVQTRTKDPSKAGSSRKKPTRTVPDSVFRTVNESKDIDTYNAMDSIAYDALSIPMDYSFMEDFDAAGGEVGRVKMPGLGFTAKKTDEPARILPQRKSSRTLNVSKPQGAKESSALRICERRLARRRQAGKDRGLLEIASRYLDRSEQGSSEGGPRFPVDNSVRIAAMEALSKLAAHRPAAKMLAGFVRSLCPLLRKYPRDTGIVESAAYCIQMVSDNNYSSIKSILPHYYLLRELVAALSLEVEDRAKASVLATLAVLLKQSCRLVYSLSAFSIRKSLHYWLRMIPSQAPAYACVSALLVVYCLSRYYKRRDYIASKTLLTLLTNILQVDETSEACRVYAACCLGFMTFANRRFRQLGPAACSAEKVNLLLISSVQEVSSPFPDEEAAQDKGMLSTMELFKAAGLDERFFQQLSSDKSFGTPVNFFNIFLVNLLLKRATPVFGTIALRNLDTLMAWLKKCVAEKQSMSRTLNNTLLDSIPTLSFHRHGYVGASSNLDKTEFYVCVDPDPQRTFPGSLLLDDVCPLYTVYSLKSNQTKPDLPWDVYWKERFDPKALSLLIPHSYKSVFAGSMFGMGGVYEEDALGNAACLLCNVLDRKLLPTGPEARPFFRHETPEAVDVTRKDAPIFGIETDRTDEWFALKHMLKRRVDTSLRRTVLPTIHGYIAYLTGGTTEDARKPLRDLPRHLLKPYNKNVEAILKKNILFSMNEFYRNPAKQFTKYQFELLTKALKEPPKVWTEALQSVEEPSTNAKVARLKRILKNFPNCLLEGIPDTTFHKTKDQRSLEIATCARDVCTQVADLITSTILAAFEKLSDVTPPLFCPNVSDVLQPGSDRNKSRMQSVKKSYASYKKSFYAAKKDSLVRPVTLLSADYDWSSGLATYGKAFLDYYSRPYSDALARNLIRYSLETEDSTRRTSGSFSKSRTLLSRFQTAASRGAKEPNDGSKNDHRYWDNSGSFVKSRQRLDPLRDELRRDSGRRKVELSDLASASSSQEGLTRSRKTHRPRPTIADLYLPTKRELVLDFFVQPRAPEFRRPFSQIYPKEKGRPIVDKISELLFSSLSRRVARKVPELLRDAGDFEAASRRICNAIVAEQRRRIRGIDYSDLSARENNVVDVRCPAGPTADIDFALFFRKVKKEMLDIFKRESRVGCWYSDILKMMARNVCKRLEGPYGYVTEYLMRHHRRELKRLLGTSVIPLGCLRIGGQLERAVLFKFLADRLMIPCELVRENISSAWVRVPPHPFLHPRTQAACVVELEDSPGTLIKKPEERVAAPKGEPIASDLALGRGPEEDMLYDDDIAAFLAENAHLLPDLSSTKRDEAKNPQPRKDSFPWPGRVEETSCYAALRKNGEEEEEEEHEDDPSPCSSPLSEHYFTGGRVRSAEKAGEPCKSPTNRPAEKGVEVIQSSEKRSYGKHREFMMYEWHRSDDGRYSTVIGEVPPSAFVGNFADGVLGSSPPLYSMESEDRPSYRRVSGEQLLEEMSSVGTGFLRKEAEVPSKLRHIEEGVSEDDCDKWLNILISLSEDEFVSFSN